MLDLGGLFYWWRRATEDHTCVEEESEVELQAHNLIQQSCVYRSTSQKLYATKILEPTDDGSCFLYRIFQKVDTQNHWERIGSIQVMNKDSALWVRWGIIPHSIRLFDTQELSKLLKVLEKANAPLSPYCLQEFGQKKTLGAFY